MTQARWQALWLLHSQRRGWLARLLWPVSLIYGALIAVRRVLYQLGLKQSRHVSVPVVVIGNVVVGGAGKTPTVLSVVNHLRARGWRPGVVSRGHGRKSRQVVHVGPNTERSDSGDEPALIHLHTQVPVCVSANRLAAARALLAAHPEVDIIVCDDGLQHLALHRDLQIIVFDDRGTGNGWLLPAGLLREPWPPNARTRSTDLVLHQRREDAPGSALARSPGTPVFGAVRRLADHAVGPTGEQLPLDQLRGQRLTAVAGTARPGVFFDMLRARGIEPTVEVGLPDHAALSDYAALMQDSSTTLLCTEKDAVKLFPTLIDSPVGRHPQVWAIPLEMTPDPAFFTALDERLKPLKRRT
ncbi:tetraacyldisaccharide 4'-kinase [Hydrogenophaga sp.]|uniref:tetraacyldisaccharide 4'-kinase n=1 Tax=Hydrogenophaga sp. TaxID=1904254 RepID=UPI0027307455|nr:tetraacyldisaccharide 4'-kinase [Hydrogenophaga sp.]MDP2074268.1 tetraacyldisaccharide 4'-kinase [Hydrogenophaga sp.]MDP3108357.1 tetraacyldisaccharide 4'-kinase [Hydrogenophaga sp.]MDP3348785.1 tetraacyldisaccharide 4'-kinase [Hydrogenophaga sp.]